MQNTTKFLYFISIFEENYECIFEVWAIDNLSNNFCLLLD